MNNEELKPCPFCGGEAEMDQTGKNEFRIRCKECHMGLKQKVLRKSLEWLAETLKNKWNTRPDPTKVETVEDKPCACFNTDECHPDCSHQKSCYSTTDKD